MTDAPYRYFLKLNDDQEHEVSRADFIKAERLAGFNGPEYELATHGFTGDVYPGDRIRGRVEYVKSAGKVEMKLGEEWTDVTEHLKPTSHGTSGGVELTDELIQKLADEAEAGYDIRPSADPTAHLPGMFDDAKAYCLSRFSYPQAAYVDTEARERHVDNDARSTATDRDFAMPWNAGYARGVSEGRRQVLLEEIENAEGCAKALQTLEGQEQLAEFYWIQAEHFRNRLAAMKEDTDD